MQVVLNGILRIIVFDFFFFCILSAVLLKQFIDPTAPLNGLC